MSDISSIYSGTSMVDWLTKTSGEESSILDTSSTATSAAKLLAENRASSQRAKNAYSVSATSGVGQAALNKALSEMGAQGGRVTFKDIAAHREKLETNFSIDMRLELAKEGVSMETDFTLTMDSEGKIEVSCDDALAKEKIEKYLEENPKVCEQFGYIQALSNLERARQSPAASSQAWQNIRDAKAELQTQAVEIFFGDALSSGMNYSSLLASFSPFTGSGSAADTTSFYTGVNYTV